MSFNMSQLVDVRHPPVTRFTMGVWALIVSLHLETSWGQNSSTIPHVSCLRPAYESKTAYLALPKDAACSLQTNISGQEFLLCLSPCASVDGGAFMEPFYYLAEKGR